jgi:death-on-curing protein
MNESLEVDFLTLDDVLELHREMISVIGGSHGVKEQGALESALAQPQMTFGGEDFYPTVAEKAAALAFSFIQNHPFNDGNKRAGHAAMLLFLDINGYSFIGDLDDQERVIFAVADSKMGREEFTEWVMAHVVERQAQ